jgi:hypothetical protein
MNDSVYEYRIRFDAGREEVFRYVISGEEFELAAEDDGDAPEWTELGYCQCPNCPLSAAEHSHCPVALQLHTLVARFDDTHSIDPVEVEAHTPGRQIQNQVSLQEALASILDLVMPVSGCPVTAVMKPLVRDHLPLATEEETITRVTGMYLLTQYFNNQESGQTEEPFAGLEQVYKGLHELNTAIAKRLQHATRSDSVKNAIALIDMYSLLIPVLLEDQLAELRESFSGGAIQAKNRHIESAKAYRLSGALGGDGDQPAGLPKWMRSIATGTETTEERAERERGLEELMHKADSLELEPLGDEEEASEAPDELGPAVYKLPDD